jgi:hypothetical protein
MKPDALVEVLAIALVLQASEQLHKIDASSWVHSGYLNYNSSCSANAVIDEADIEHFSLVAPTPT